MIDKDNLPKHIAIIMDGNGRWAKDKGLPREVGHRAGISRVREIISAANELGIKAVTFFAFSAENWSRPKREVDMLMRELGNFLDRELEQLDSDNIKFKVIGGGDPIPGYLQKKIQAGEEKTKDNTGLAAVLAINYGSRQEILKAVKKFAASLLEGKASIENLTQSEFSKYLDTAGLPDPDLLVRTSGEMRISNFLLWQISYAELYFPNSYWPDFSKDDLKEAIEVYQKRNRRFGGLDVRQKDS